jgi:hypothetical protein
MVGFLALSPGDAAKYLFCYRYFFSVLIPQNRSVCKKLHVNAHREGYLLALRAFVPFDGWTTPPNQGLVRIHRTLDLMDTTSYGAIPAAMSVSRPPARPLRPSFRTYLRQW